MKKITLLFTFAAMTAGSGWGGSFSSSGRGTTSAEFLKQPAGARAAAMGGAVTASQVDAFAMFINPAALNSVKGTSLALSHNSFLESTHGEHAAVSKQIGEKTTLGLSAQFFSAGSVPRRDTLGNQTGSFTPSDLALGLGLARKIGGHDVGLTLKFIRSEIVNSASAYAVDLGYLSPAFWNDKIRLSAAAGNLGSDLEFNQESESLPLFLTAGSVHEWTEQLRTTLDFRAPKDNAFSPAAGVEYDLRLGDSAALSPRVGYDFRRSDAEGLSGLSTGLGFSLSFLHLDYAFLPLNDLGDAHLFSLSVGF